MFTVARFAVWGLAVGGLVLSGSSSEAGVFSRMRDRKAGREEARTEARAEAREKAEVGQAGLTVTEAGLPAIRWRDGSESLIGKDVKTGELIAAPKAEAKKSVRVGGRRVEIVPGAKVVPAGTSSGPAK